MVERGKSTQAEILSQPEAWRVTLEVLEGCFEELIRISSRAPYEGVVFTGCGSTYYLASSAAALLSEVCEQPARAFPASELWLHPRAAYTRQENLLLVAVSRSGETTETIRACEAFLSASRGRLLTITCVPGSKLSSLGSLNIVLPSGQEDSIAQTRSFSSMYLAATLLAAAWNGGRDSLPALRQLPSRAGYLLQTYASLAKQLGGDASIERFYFLGSGPRYGLACELSLKMKEMSLSHSEPFHFLEFRHGPISMATQGAMVVALRSESDRQPETALLDEVRAQGARTLVIGEGQADVVFNSTLDENLKNVLYLPFGQLLAYERAMQRGLNPDRPEYLKAFVTLESES